METKIIYSIYGWWVPTNEIDRDNTQSHPIILPQEFETEEEAEEWLMKENVQVSKKLSKFFVIAKTFKFYDEEAEKEEAEGRYREIKY